MTHVRNGIFKINFWVYKVSVNFFQWQEKIGMVNYSKMLPDTFSNSLRPVHTGRFNRGGHLSFFTSVCERCHSFVCVSSHQPTTRIQGESCHRGGFQTTAATCERFHKQTLNNRQCVSNRAAETALCEQALL